MVQEKVRGSTVTGLQISASAVCWLCESGQIASVLVCSVFKKGCVIQWDYCGE